MDTIIPAKGHVPWAEAFKQPTHGVKYVMLLATSQGLVRSFPNKLSAEGSFSIDEPDKCLLISERQGWTLLQLLGDGNAALILTYREKLP